MRKTENEVVNEYRMIKEEYAYNPDIMCKDDERTSRVKYIIDKKLSKSDKIIIDLYIDYQSYRKLGQKMNLCHMTIRREVLRIKNIIMQEMKRTEPKFKIGEIAFVDLEGWDDETSHYEPEFDTPPLRVKIVDIAFDNGCHHYTTEEGDYYEERMLFKTEEDAWSHQLQVCTFRLKMFEERRRKILDEIDRLTETEHETL